MTYSQCSANGLFSNIDTGQRNPVRLNGWISKRRSLFQHIGIMALGTQLKSANESLFELPAEINDVVDNQLASINQSAYDVTPSSTA